MATGSTLLSEQQREPTKKHSKAFFLLATVHPSVVAPLNVDPLFFFRLSNARTARFAMMALPTQWYTLTTNACMYLHRVTMPPEDNEERAKWEVLRQAHLTGGTSAPFVKWCKDATREKSRWLIEGLRHEELEYSEESYRYAIVKDRQLAIDEQTQIAAKEEKYLRVLEQDEEVIRVLLLDNLLTPAPKSPPAVYDGHEIDWDAEALTSQRVQYTPLSLEDYANILRKLRVKLQEFMQHTASPWKLRGSSNKHNPLMFQEVLRTFLQEVESGGALSASMTLSEDTISSIEGGASLLQFRTCYEVVVVNKAEISNPTRDADM
jgi:hypothetical protein